MTKITDHLNIQGMHPMEARKFIGQKTLKEKLEGKKGFEFIKQIGTYFAKEIALTYNRIVHKAFTGQWINKNSIQTSVENNIKELSQIDYNQVDENLDQVEAYMALGSMQVLCRKLQKKMETFNFALRNDLENIKKNFEEFIIKKNEENLRKAFDNFIQQQPEETEKEISEQAPEQEENTSQTPQQSVDKPAQDPVDEPVHQNLPHPLDTPPQVTVEHEPVHQNIQVPVEEEIQQPSIEEVKTGETDEIEFNMEKLDFRQELKNSFPSFIRFAYGEDYDLKTREGRMSSQLYNSLQQNWPIGGTMGMGLMTSNDNAHLLKLMDENYYDNNSDETIAKDVQRALDIIAKGYTQDSVLEWEYPNVSFAIQCFENILSDHNNQ